MDPVTGHRQSTDASVPLRRDPLLQSVIDATGEAVVLVDTDLRIVSTSRKASGLVDGSSFCDTFNVGRARAFGVNGHRGPAQRVLDTGRPETVHAEVVRHDGLAETWCFSLTRLTGPDGTTTGVMLSGRPYEPPVAEAGPVGRLIHDGPPRLRVDQGMLTLRAGKAVVANRGFLDIFGLSTPHDVRGRSLSSFLDPSCRDRVGELVRRWSGDGASAEPVELRGVRADGTPVPVRIRANGATAGSPDVLRLDVTRLETTAPQADEGGAADFFAAYDALPEEVVVVDENRHILFVNRAARNTYGDLNRQVCTQDLFGCDAVCTGCLLGDIFSRPGAVCHREVRRNGRPFDVVGVTLQPDAVGQPLRALMISRDISAEETNHDREKMESIGLLARSIAHDFNNIMVGVVGYASLIRDLAPPESEIAECAQLIEQSGQTVRNLTRNLQVFAGRSKPKPRVVCLNEVVGMTAQLVAKSIARNIDLSVVLEPSLWYSESDPDQVHQVILNLCMNAGEAMPQGGSLSIHTANVECPRPIGFAGQTCPPGRYVQIEIADSGKGMEPELVKKIFEPMFSTKGRGRGFGLATVFGIIKVSGGWVQVDSRLGKGSTFRVGLPATVKTPPRDVEEASDLPRGGETILVTDDEASVRDLAGRMLSGLGYRVLVASDGMEALEKVEAQAGRIDLLLLDIVMPRMSGGETFKAVKARYPHMKVLFSSGYEKDGLLETVTGSEKAPFLHKPYRLAELACSVRSVLDARTGV